MKSHSQPSGTHLPHPGRPAGGDLHGYGIIKEVESLSDCRVRLSPGTLYGALDRLKNDGLVETAGEERVEGTFAPLLPPHRRPAPRRFSRRSTARNGSARWRAPNWRPAAPERPRRLRDRWRSHESHEPAVRFGASRLPPRFPRRERGGSAQHHADMRDARKDPARCGRPCRSATTATGCGGCTPPADPCLRPSGKASPAGRCFWSRDRPVWRCTTRPEGCSSHGPGPPSPPSPSLSDGFWPSPFSPRVAADGALP